MTSLIRVRTMVFVVVGLGMIESPTAEPVFAAKKDAPAQRANKLQITGSLPIQQVKMTGRLGERRAKCIAYLKYLHDQVHPWREVPRKQDRTKPAYKDERIGRDVMLHPFANRDGGRIRNWDGEYGGKWIDAVSMMLVDTSDKDLADKLEFFVKSVRQTQEKDGYLGIEPADKRGSGWDMWSQWYVLHGLLSHYEYQGDRASLETASRMGEYILANYSPPEPKISILEGCLNGACTVAVLDQLVRLYEHTGKKDYLRLSNYISENYEPIKQMKVKQSPPLAHAYTLVAYLGGLVKLSQVTGSEQELHWLEKVWESMLNEHVFPTGSLGIDEKLTDKPIADLDGKELQETCATVEWLVFTHRLYEATGNVRYVHTMENTVYNALLAAQSVDGTGCTYFTPLSSTKKGKQFFVGPTMCCYWSGPRGLAHLPQYVYHTDADGLRVDLYESASGQFTWQGSTITIHQDSDYPAAGKINLSLDMNEPTEFTLKLRLPEWARNIAVAVNEQAAGEPLKAGRYVELKRTWRNKDRVTLTMDMAVTLKSLPDGKVCISRGPEILSADARDNPDLDLNKLACVDGDVPTLTTLAAGKDGRRLYNCTMKVNGVEKVVTLTPYADAGNEGAGYRSSFRAKD